MEKVLKFYGPTSRREYFRHLERDLEEKQFCRHDLLSFHIVDFSPTITI